MADQEQTRFRSFAERYVIERASGFKSDTDAWTAVQDAMRIYRMIEQQSGRVHPQADDAQQAGVGQQALQTGRANTIPGLSRQKITCTTTL